MWMVRLGLPMIFCAGSLKINPLFSPVTIQCENEFIFIKRAKCHMCFCAFPFACRSTHVVSIYRSSESFPTLVADRPIARGVVFVFPNPLRPTMLAIPHIRTFLVIFSFLCLPSCLVSKSPLLKCRNHRSHASCYGACSPQASRSNRYDSAAVLFK